MNQTTKKINAAIMWLGEALDDMMPADDDDPKFGLLCHAERLLVAAAKLDNPAPNPYHVEAKEASV